MFEFNETKDTIFVPADVRFLSKWDDFKLSNFPSKCIINKELPGCGFTEYCMSSNENIILCSPRKMLLKNKWKQHKNTSYLVVNEMDKDPNVDKDISKEQKGKAVECDPIPSKDLEEKNAIIYNRIKRDLISYLFWCRNNNLPAKILVTYDSYRLVYDIIQGEGCTSLGGIGQFYTVIDEFQSILHDARFKSDTEMSFMNYLEKSPTSIFVSATPILKEYIKELSKFKDLPYIELDWYERNHSRIMKPDMTVLTMKSVGEKAKEVIQSYLDGKFEKIVVIKNGQPVEIESKEAVLYVNSVNHIIGLISKMKLTPDQVNILCSNTDDNRKRIQAKLGKKFDIGEVPLENEPNKMFTFCTRTVYLGADFHSTCARTFIFSDSNSDCLAVDISEDLPQILGRQRDEDNPWKNAATLYYKTTADYNKMTQDDFNKKIEAKSRKTEELIGAYVDGSTKSRKDALAENYQTVAKILNYKNDYVAVNTYYNEFGEKILMPVENELVKVNEIRAFRIQQIDYKDRFTVFNKLNRTNFIQEDDVVNRKVTEFFQIYESKTTMVERLRLLCENGFGTDIMKAILDQISDSDVIKSYYMTLGPDKLHGLGYNITKIKKELGIVVFDPEILKEKIYSEFNIGDKLYPSEIKSKLSILYSSINYNKTPKATDINNFFETKESSKRVNIDGKNKVVKYL